MGKRKGPMGFDDDEPKEWDVVGPAPAVPRRGLVRSSVRHSVYVMFLVGQDGSGHDHWVVSVSRDPRVVSAVAEVRCAHSLLGRLSSGLPRDPTQEAMREPFTWRGFHQRRFR